MIKIDEIGLDNGRVNSAPGAEFAHYTSNMSALIDGSEFNNGNSLDSAAESRENDNVFIINTVGEASYYSFSTMTAETLTIRVSSD
jgi:hypothetical protein